MIPSHIGLADYEFERRRWSKAPGPEHDYMGFAATRDRLYSSGHPARGSGLVNPFGLIASRDGGKSWEKLGLEGETDFHLLAASWSTNAIAVWNPAPSSRIRQTGLHVTLDDGKTWKAAAAGGLSGNPAALAMHPQDARRIAVATSSGVYLSSDAGERFGLLRSGEGFAMYFDLDGKDVWFSVVEGKARLFRASLAGGAPTELQAPPLERDAIAWIAQNPVAREVYAVASFRRNVFLTRDGGRTWKAIAREGEGLRN
jgi:photosystem II stability/assembly factor-like uncharacterized protein